MNTPLQASEPMADFPAQGNKVALMSGDQWWVWRKAHPYPYAGYGQAPLVTPPAEDKSDRMYKIAVVSAVCSVLFVGGFYLNMIFGKGKK